MGNPVFKFTLSHANQGTKVISEPDGWKDAKLKFERHPDFHSLVEYFEGAFVFYGSNGTIDGGIDFIKEVESLYGLDAEIAITIQADIDGDGNYEETIFTGQLDLTELEEVKDNKLKIPIIPSNLWAKFITRKDTPVNLRSSTDLDGNVAEVIDSVTINMTSQKVRSKFKRNVSFNDDNLGLFPIAQEVAGTTSYLIFDNANNDLDEIDERFEYGTQISDLLPTDVSKYLFLVKYPGSYRIEADVRYSLIFGGSRTVTVEWFLAYKVNNSATLTTASLGTTSGVGVTSHSTGISSLNLDTTITLLAGGEIYVYGVVTLNSGTTITYLSDYDSNIGAPFEPVYTHFEVTADTTFQETTSPAYLLHDSVDAIVRRLNGHRLYSLFLGSLTTNGRSYASDGCGWNYAVLPGLQIRGYTFDEKIFSMSFMKWWNGANPIFNLGVGYDRVSSQDVIRIEGTEFFYDHTSASLQLSNVRSITRQYDTSLIYNRIEIGYHKWQSEDLSGLDDPQSKRVFATRIQKVNNTLSIYSDFIAASIAIETTRRQMLEKSKDYKFDNDIFIIALNENDVSADVYVPELDENFSAVTDLLNSDARYNIYLTPAYNFIRWQNVPNGCLQKYLTSVYKFVSGEGNYDMLSASNHTCHISTPSGVVWERGFNDDGVGNFPILGGYLHLPQLYTIDINLTWEQYVVIRNNRHKCIEISQTTTNYRKFFIKELIFEVCKGKAKIIAWPYDDINLGVVTTEQPVIDCVPESDPVVPEVFDEDYQAVLDYATGQGYDLPSDAQQTLQNQFILDLKSADIWDGLDLLYLFATDGDSDFAKINWKDPGNFTATEVNSPTFDASVGFGGNGSSSYLNTGWDPDNNGVNFTLNEGGVFAYSNTNLITPANTYLFGSHNSANAGRVELIPKSNTSVHVYAINGAGTDSVGSTVNSEGFFHIRRTATNDLRLYKNGAQVGLTETGVTTDALNDDDIYLLVSNFNGTPTNHILAQISVFGIGASLTGKETELYNAWNDYFTSL
jgi:hypothetical protein